MTVKTLFSALVLAAGVLSAPSAFAGVYLEEQQTQSTGGQSQTATVKSWIDGDKIRMDDPRAGGVVLINTKVGSIVGVQPGEKSWWRLKDEDVRAFGSMMLMGYGIRSGPDGKLQVPQNMFVKTGKKKKIGQWEAYEVKVNVPLPANAPIKKLSSSLWFADVKGYSPSMVRNRLKMMLGDGPEAEAFLKQWDALEGVPVLEEMEMQAGAQSVSMSKELKKVASQTLKPADMEVPKAFKQVEDPFTVLKRQMPQMQQGGMPGGAAQQPPPMQ